MQLTLHADYSLRVLLYLAGEHDRLVTTQEISEAYGISRTHLVRVVQTLHNHGFLIVTAGRTGGAKLARHPSEINLADVIRKAEPSFRMVECFDLENNTCPIVSVCKLRGVLAKALDSFFDSLAKYTLADVMRNPNGKSLADFLQIQTLS